MFALGPIGFATPWLLAGLAALPVLWWLLRAVPPAPIRRAFPGVTLLLGLDDREVEARRTPLWLMLLRMVALAAMILGFAGPVLHPTPHTPGSGPLLVLIDDGWAAAPDWQARLDAAAQALKAAEAAGRPAALVATSAPPPPGILPLRSAGEAARRLPGLAPQAYSPGFDAVLDWAKSVDARFETLWLSDGLDSPNRAALADLLSTHGPLRVLEPPRPRLGLIPARIEGGLVRLTALRSRADTAQELTLTGLGPDPTGTERELARTSLSFDAGATRAETELSLPPELRNRISRFRIEGNRSAGALTLADDSLRRRKVGLVTATAGRETLELLSPSHYLRQALVPTAGVIEGPVSDLIAAAPDAILLPDSTSLSAPEAKALTQWVTDGGLLLRFAGPRLAAEAGQMNDDPLMPVHLRAGGRSVGGAMSWGAPQKLAPFPEASPFYGLVLPDDVTVSSQVLAEPGPELASRTIAALADGTPLVTRKALGAGEVVLFHSSANAEWSSLALSGLFVQMLERLAVSTKAEAPGKADLAGTIWVPDQVLDGFGSLHSAGDRPGLPGEALTGTPGPDLPPGLYRTDKRLIAVNTLGPDAVLAPARWPAGITPDWQGESPERNLAGPLLMAALLMLAADILATLALSGRLSRSAVKSATLGLAALTLPDAAEAAAPVAGMSPSTLPAALAMALILALLAVALRYSRTGPKAGPRPKSRQHLLPARTAPLGAPGERRSGPRTGAFAASRHAVRQAVHGWNKWHRPQAGMRHSPDRRALLSLHLWHGPVALPSSVAALLFSLLLPLAAQAQDIAPATLAAADNVTLAYVITSDTETDRISKAGLTGLSNQIFQRTSVEPSPPVGVDLEQDELSVYPLLYWPITQSQPQPSSAAYARLNAYLRAGGMILFDTRDGDLTTSGASATPEATRLRALALPLDIPPLEPVPGDHVLTRAFYLLDTFPGRYQGGPVWVEAAPADAARAEGMPFRNLNDGVTPVVIGGNDWASAWAVDANGIPLLPVGRGMAGERQREMAYRFGVNLVMHVLTGNYKSDQVHVPALLERLGE